MLGSWRVVSKEGVCSDVEEGLVRVDCLVWIFIFKEDRGGEGRGGQPLKTGYEEQIRYSLTIVWFWF